MHLHILLLVLITTWPINDNIRSQCMLEALHCIIPGTDYPSPSYPGNQQSLSAPTGVLEQSMKYILPLHAACNKYPSISTHQSQFSLQMAPDRLNSKSIHPVMVNANYIILK